MKKNIRLRVSTPRFFWLQSPRTLGGIHMSPCDCVRKDTLISSLSQTLSTVGAAPFVDKRKNGMYTINARNFLQHRAGIPNSFVLLLVYLGHGILVFGWRFHLFNGKIGASIYRDPQVKTGGAFPSIPSFIRTS